MKINELILGNWYSNGEKSFVMDENWLIHALLHYQEFKEVLPKPIPLTEKWLLKFGFVDGRKRIGNIDYLQFSESRRGAYIVSIDIDGANVVWTQIIKYVHQLQNLYFVLVGQELIIKD